MDDHLSAAPPEAETPQETLERALYEQRQLLRSSYDRLVTEARRTRDNQQRYELYAQLEQKLVGADGALPMLPIYWYTYTTLEKESVKDTYNLNLLNQVDLTKVEVAEQ